MKDRRYRIEQEQMSNMWNVEDPEQHRRDRCADDLPASFLCLQRNYNQRCPDRRQKVIIWHGGKDSWTCEEGSYQGSVVQALVQRAGLRSPSCLPVKSEQSASDTIVDAAARRRIADSVPRCHSAGPEPRSLTSEQLRG